MDLHFVGMAVDYLCVVATTVVVGCVVVAVVYDKDT